jgi:hypothetical protein
MHLGEAQGYLGVYWIVNSYNVLEDRLVPRRPIHVPLVMSIKEQSYESRSSSSPYVRITTTMGSWESHFTLNI